VERVTRPVLIGLAVAALTLGACGCFNPFSPRIAASVGIAEPKPQPSSPTGVIYLFQWCYRNRAFNEYTEIFTDDYVFTFSSLDASGAPYRDKPWRREDELISTQNLFVTGKAGVEAATSITLDFGNTLFDEPDSRVGMGDRYHRQVNARIVLVVNKPSGIEEVQGEAKFFVVRGDKAAIPPELGLQPDSTRWYIDGWEDNTVQSGGGASARPAGPALAQARRAGASPADALPLDVSFGQLKVQYR
jgi:hypothetical protein